MSPKVLQIHLLNELKTVLVNNFNAQYGNFGQWDVICDIICQNEFHITEISETLSSYKHFVIVDIYLKKKEEKKFFLCNKSK